VPSVVTHLTETTDIAVIGAGAAGLMAAIWAGRTNQTGERRIVVLDSAKRLGAKILVAGGGRCNVTHDVVDERAFAGSTPGAIRTVLRRFGVPRTIEFFRELGVELKREETGKLFPTTDDAHTVLDALLRAAADSGVVIRNPARVETVTVVPAADHRFEVSGDWGTLRARRLVLATGGKSLPKTGSDGHGHGIARALGHTITGRTFPGLVPLTLPRGDGASPPHFICTLSGVTIPATLELRSGTGRKLVAFTDSTLCTHFGLSGPGVLDISRHLTDARATDPGATLVINWLPGRAFDAIDRTMVGLGRARIGPWLSTLLPDRLAEALCRHAGIDPATPGDQLSRDARRTLVRAVVEMPLPITGDRGFTYAEVTAGGVPLSELHLSTMESRICPGLFLCGEICDVDGRVGGYNFQWAWASGFIAGSSV
jgi:predicted Rossmann fold flavoprotein